MDDGLCGVARCAAQCVCACICVWIGMEWERQTWVLEKEQTAKRAGKNSKVSAKSDSG